MKGDVTMTVVERINHERLVNKPVYGRFPAKPDTAKSLTAWIREGKCPIEGATLKMYQMGRGDNQGYGYYDACDVRLLTEEEKISISIAFPPKEKKQAINTKKVEKPKVEKPQKVEIKSSKSDVCKILSPEDWKTKEIVVFDTETTGFTPGKDEILQFSAADNFGHTMDLYIKPTHNNSWDEAMAVHHITPEMVADAPTAWKLKSRIQLLFDQADYVIGHNVPFDIRFVKKSFGIDIDPEKVIDTCSLFRKLYPKSMVPNHKLETAVRMFADKEIKDQYEDGAHSAIVDVLATLNVYRKFCEQEWNN